MSNILEGLNDKQYEAVTTTSGPLLIIAGAGSGKTTVLVKRISYLLEKKLVLPQNILAITFTNKAANEMKERIDSLLGGDYVKKMWVGTFHSVCVRILRSTIDLLGYGSDFVIYDTADTKTLMKECYKEMDIDDKNYPINQTKTIISNAKNELMDPATFEQSYKGDFRMSVIASIYKRYQEKLKRNNALDFDDIILNTVKILSSNEDVLTHYQAKFPYIFVDEYQDTNIAQYMLVNLLGAAYENVCVVGDDDQSIYKFRGANIGNIFSFEEDYPTAKRITLDRNYRSTQTILNAANAVIGNNQKRMGKELWTEKGDGEKIGVYTANNEYKEAEFIARKIKKHHNDGGSFSDCAILYRTNAQSRVIEEMLLREGVPYRVLAGLRFYDRKEIKDIIAYLRVIHNPHDDISLKRIINEPKRKIGNATLEKAQKLADEHDCSIFDIISEAKAYPELKSAAEKLISFCSLINSLVKLKDAIELVDFIKRVLLDSGYMAMLTAETTIENQTRIENLEEFVNAASEFTKNEETDNSLASFLETVSLISDIDSYDETEEAAILMTIHSAKGLEFDTVFLAGLEEGLFPGFRSIGCAEDIEEERRLCYVAITRAQRKLYITKAMQRTTFGKTAAANPSRFFNEIPKEYLDDLSAAKTTLMQGLGKFGIHFENNTVQKTPGYQEENYAEKTEEKPEIHFNKGDIVMHRKFGQGTILSAKQFGNDAILEINFDNVGHKQLMAAFAKLKKIK